MAKPFFMHGHILFDYRSSNFLINTFICDPGA
jgi:hypothetical protein